MEQQFLADVMTNPNNKLIMERWGTLDLPDGWLVAGCLFQTIWNLISNNPPESGIKDYDLFYFDSSDRSAKAEQAIQLRADKLFSDLKIFVEVSNQARVHLWYEEYFCRPYPKLHNSRDGIDRFLIPSTCVGINPHEVYAPNGLEQLYRGDLSINPLTPYSELFMAKAKSYQQRWPFLTILTQNCEGVSVP